MTLSRRAALFLATLALTAFPAAIASAQAVYGPSEGFAPAEEDEPVPLIEPEPCEEELREDGTIVVCRERVDSQAYMSPLPAPVQSDRRHVPGLTDPPCWMRGLGPPSCIRMGSVPPYPPLIDTTKFPEPLSAEDAAAVYALESEAGQDESLTGERVPIDLSEGD